MPQTDGSGWGLPDWLTGLYGNLFSGGQAPGPPMQLPGATPPSPAGTTMSGGVQSGTPSGQMMPSNPAVAAATLRQLFGLGQANAAPQMTLTPANPQPLGPDAGPPGPGSGGAWLTGAGGGIVSPASRNMPYPNQIDPTGRWGPMGPPIGSAAPATPPQRPTSPPPVAGPLASSVPRTATALAPAGAAATNPRFGVWDWQVPGMARGRSPIYTAANFGGSTPGPLGATPAPVRPPPVSNTGPGQNAAPAPPAAPWSMGPLQRGFGWPASQPLGPPMPPSFRGGNYGYGYGTGA